MSYSKSLLRYQDVPAYGLLLKLIALIMPAASLVASIYVRVSGDISGSLALLLEAFIIAFIFWAVFPRKYQVYEDHICIVLGGPFRVKVGFENIKTVRVRSGLSFGVNFATRITKSYVEIAKRKGLRIAITPTANDLFVKEANLALNQWVKTSDRVELTDKLL